MTEPHASTSDHLESEQVESLISAAGVDGVREILSAFWRSTDELLHELMQHLNDHNFDEAGRSAHALKGSAANVGAKRLSETAHHAEEACRNGLIDAARAHLDAAREDYRLARDCFESLLNRTLP